MPVQAKPALRVAVTSPAGRLSGRPTRVIRLVAELLALHARAGAGTVKATGPLGGSAPVRRARWSIRVLVIAWLASTVVVSCHAPNWRAQVAPASAVSVRVRRRRGSPKLRTNDPAGSLARARPEKVVESARV